MKPDVRYVPGKGLVAEGAKGAASRVKGGSAGTGVPGKSGTKPKRPRGAALDAASTVSITDACSAPAGTLGTEREKGSALSPREFVARETGRLSVLPDLAELQKKLIAVEEEKARKRAQNAVHQKAFRDRQKAKKSKEGGGA